MPRISLTDFVDIVSSSGTPKANKVRQIKHRPPYIPAFDFYKPLRDRIIETHGAGESKDYLQDLMSSINDRKKITAYPHVLEGYVSWWGRKNLEWFDPPNDLFSLHGVDVSVNPELGLHINGEPHLIKLYFKSEDLTKNRVDVIHHLLDSTLATRCPENTIMAVLEIRRPRLYVPTIQIQNLTAALGAELAYISDLWSNV